MQRPAIRHRIVLWVGPTTADAIYICPCLLLGKVMANVEVVLFVSAVQDNRFSSEHAGTGHHQAIMHLSTIKRRCDCLERHTTEVSRSSVLCALLWHAAAVERCRPVHSRLRDYWQISRVLLLCYVTESCLVVHASSHPT